jgi:hypothetical protein
MAFPFDERHVQPHAADRSADGTPSRKRGKMFEPIL